MTSYFDSSGRLFLQFISGPISRLISQGTLRAPTIALLFLAASCAHVEPQENLAEKLGFDHDAKILIIHADDIGMSKSVNEATLRALDSKVVSSAGIIPTGTNFEAAAKVLKKRPELDIGVHLNFTSEWVKFPQKPVAEFSQVKSLIDKKILWSSPEGVATHATKEDFAREMDAQIQKVLRSGIKPTHLDSHSAVVYLNRDFLEAYIDEARKYHLMPFLLKLTDENEAMIKAIGFPLEELRPVLRDAEEKGLAVLNTFYMDEQNKSPEKRRAAYDEFFVHLQPGLSVILLDLADENNPEIKKRVAGMAPGNNDISGMFSDRDFFTDTKTLHRLKDLDIHLVSWREVQNVVNP